MGVSGQPGTFSTSLRSVLTFHSILKDIKFECCSLIAKLGDTFSHNNFWPYTLIIFEILKEYNIILHENWLNSTYQGIAFSTLGIED